MMDAGAGERTVFLSNVPAGERERRFACSGRGGLHAHFSHAGAVCQAAVDAGPGIHCNLSIGAGDQRPGHRGVLARPMPLCARKGAGLLAGGYLFTALMSAVHALTFPGLFAAPVCLAPVRRRQRGFTFSGTAAFRASSLLMRFPQRSDRGAGVRGARRCRDGASPPFVLACRSVATFGQRLLPSILRGNHYTPAAILVVSRVWIAQSRWQRWLCRGGGRIRCWISG